LPRHGVATVITLAGCARPAYLDRRPNESSDSHDFDETLDSAAGGDQYAGKAVKTNACQKQKKGKARISATFADVDSSARIKAAASPLQAIRRFI
jgi:hypothetical protein